MNTQIRYNLGTALARDDESSAEDELARATLTPNREIRGLAHYNTGALRLDRALYADVPDSVRMTGMRNGTSQWPSDSSTQSAHKSGEVAER